MPDLINLIPHKNHFIIIRFHFIDSDSMLQVFPDAFYV